MDNILDIFNDDAFGVIPLTQSINMVPNMYGRVNQLGIFQRPGGVYAPQVAIEIDQGVLSLLPTSQRGAPAPMNQGGKRKIKSFHIPHIIVGDRITADDVSGVRAFGSGSQLETITGLVARRQTTLASKQFITYEFLLCGALKGVLEDAEGGTIYNWYTEFGITAKTVAFVLSNPETNVAAKCKTVSRHIEDNLMGDTMTRVHCLCGENFFDDLVNHAAVKEAYAFQQGLNPMRNDLRRGFEFQGIMFEEYRGQAADPEGTVRRFIGADEARFFPIGTQQTFATYDAPADYMETVNTEGLPLYSKIARDPGFNRYVELESQSNPLPICLRPAVLVKGTK
ncbi:MAG: major capsid protein [Pseudomonadota bacterium]